MLPQGIDTKPFFSYEEAKVRPLLSSWTPTRKYAERDEVVCYLHSSGSTGMPKVIPQKACCIDQEYCKTAPIAWTGPQTSLAFLPLWHAMGQLVISYSFFASVPVKQISVDPQSVTNGDGLVEAVLQHSVSFLLIPPSMIEEGLLHPKGLKAWQGLEKLMTGGAPLPVKVGDRLIQSSVHLINALGASETGPISKIQFLGVDWQYIELLPEYDCEIVQVRERFEIVARGNDRWTTNVIEDVYGRPGYSTKDLFERHPTKDHLYRLVGRADLVIVLSNGENVIAGEIEQQISVASGIRSASVFGHGKFSIGVLVELHDTVMSQDLEIAREFVWKIVQKVNEKQPSFARIQKHLIIFTNDDLIAVPRADKGTIKRSLLLERYSSAIEKAYAAIDGVLDGFEFHSERELVAFIPTFVNKSANVALRSEDNIFQIGGLDSLGAAMIRNGLISGMKQIAKHAEAASLPSGFLYENPTISKLQCALQDILSGETVRDRKAKVNDVFTKFSKSLNTCQPDRERKFTLPKVVALTGSTGFLGTFCLYELLHDPAVEHVFVLNRFSSQEVEPLARQVSLFDTYGLETSLLDLKVTFLTIETGARYLGLSHVDHQNLVQRVDLFILNAWLVNWLAPLEEFEDQLKGVTAFVNMCNLSNAKLLFVSSIASVARVQGAEEQCYEDPSVCLEQGYAESKHIAERLLKAVSSKSGIRTTVIRVGQISGDSVTGSWATSDNVAMMIKSCQELRAYPDDIGPITWIPVRKVARAILDFAKLEESQDHNIYHLQNPRSTTFAVLLPSLRSNIGDFEVINMQEWVARLKKYSGQLEECPALKVLTFFEGLAQGLAPMIKITRSIRLSKTMSDLVPIDPEIMTRYIQHWKSIGYLHEPKM